MEVNFGESELLVVEDTRGQEAECLYTTPVDSKEAA